MTDQQARTYAARWLLAGLALVALDLIAAHLWREAVWQPLHVPAFEAGIVWCAMRFSRMLGYAAGWRRSRDDQHTAAPAAE